jgi:regulatory protein
MENLKSQITALKTGKNPRIQRCSVFLDGKFAFSLDNDVVAKEKLKIGGQLSSDEIKKLVEADHFQLCLNSAFHFLSYRPRSEAETRERLVRKGYQEHEIDKVLLHLKRLKLLNDVAFAEFWKENRNSFKPRSQRAVRLELRQKGVESEVIQQVVGDIDDSENAYRLATARVGNIKTTDYQVFRRKLGSYLQRRGFNYGVINNTVKRVWQEGTHNTILQSDSVSEFELPE